MSTDANKAAVRRYIEEAENAGNLDVIDELFAPHHRVRTSRWGNRPTPASIKQHIVHRHAGFPDLHATIDTMLADGALVAVYTTWTGTHLGDYQGIPATGKAVRTAGISIYRFEDGKIVEHWDILQPVPEESANDNTMF